MPNALTGKVKMLVILPGIGHRLRDRPASFLRSALQGGPDHGILREHLVGIPTVYRLRIGPSTFVCADARGAIQNRVADSSLFSRLCNQITL
jgi:hypothetical protein